MKSITDYKKRVGGIGGIRESKIKGSKRSILFSFMDSPSYEEVSINKSSNFIGVQIVSDTKIPQDKYVLMQPGMTINPGDFICRGSKEVWICTYRDENAIYDKGLIKKCASSIRWIENDKILEQSFALKSDPFTNFGIEDGRVISLGNERRTIITQSNVNTRKINDKQRFIFDDRVWEVTARDGLTEGIIIFTLEETEFNADDNRELRIADYYKNKPNYSISILNGNFISITKDETLQINVEVKNGDKAIDSPQVIYSVSSDSIATIDENGLLSPITDGQVTVIAQFEDKTASIDVVIEDVAQDNKTVQISGTNEIMFSQSQSYTCEFKNNGNPYDDVGIFYLTADDEVSPTTLATITSQGSNSCAIKAGNEQGYVRLHVKNGGNSVVGNIRIFVKSLF